ncbi:MAG: alpha/beta hydrolase [Candidatus Kapabacteria bacterium]|nr:alpha/beta hydrolase [Candidatus Kapabacteria bacterium]
MQRTAPILAALLICWTTSVQGQPFVTRSFVADTIGTFFHSKARRHDGTDVDLRVRIWEPNTGRAARRPLIVFVHGGGFISGSFTEMDPFCRMWSQRGYVAATIEYRLGMVGGPLLDPPYLFDQHEVPRAAWRAVQDVRHGLRYLFERSTELAIDTTNYLVAGASAGAITVLHHTFWDSRSAIPPSVRAIPDAQRMSVRYSRPDLISSIDTLPFPRPCAVVSYFGAMIYPEWLGHGPFPRVFLYHQNGDIVVGCGRQKGLWGVPLPGVTEHWPTMVGSCALETDLRPTLDDPEALRVVIQPGIGHELHDVRTVDSLAAQHCAPCAIMATEVSVAQPADDFSVDWHLFSITGHSVDQGSSPAATAILRVLDRHPSGLFILRTPRETMFIMDGVLLGRR